MPARACGHELHTCARLTSHILAAAGAIDSIVDFLKAAASSTPVRDAALTILANLAMVSSHTQLIAAGVIPRMVRSLASCSEKQQCRAAAALGNLAQVDKSSGLRIVVAGAINPLINLLTTSDSEEEVQISAIMTLGYLMVCNAAAVAAANQDVLTSSGAAVAPLVRLLLSCNLDADAQESVLKVLFTLSARHARAIAAAGAIPPLVRLLHSCSAQAQLLVESLLHLIGAEGMPADVLAMEAAGAHPILVKLQGSSEQGSDMRRITTDLLTLLNCAGSSGSDMPAGSGSTKKKATEAAPLPPPSPPQQLSLLYPKQQQKQQLLPALTRLLLLLLWGRSFAGRAERLACH